MGLDQNHTVHFDYKNDHKRPIETNILEKKGNIVILAAKYDQNEQCGIQALLII